MDRVTILDCAPDAVPFRLGRDPAQRLMKDRGCGEPYLGLCPATRANRHPVSGCPAPVKMEAQAVRMALALGAAVTGLQARRDGRAVGDHFGCGLSDIALLEQAEGDPVPALAAALRIDAPDLVLAGRRGFGGNDGGMLPYQLAGHRCSGAVRLAVL